METTKTYQILIIMVVIVALIVGVIMYRKKEGYVDGPFKYFIEQDHAKVPSKKELAGHLETNEFISRPSYLSRLPPRMYSGYSGQLMGATPPTHLQAVPPEPLKFGKMVTHETDLPEELRHMSRDQVNKIAYEKYEKNLKWSDPKLPEGDMTTTSTNPDTYMYNRHIFANQKRRTLVGRDWIRGDLPIVPEVRGWHDVSVIPHLDLERGAIGAGHIGAHYQTDVTAPGDVEVKRFV